MIIADLMDTTEFRVGHAIQNLFSAVAELDNIRRSNEMRAQIQDASNCLDIEVCRDRLSRILDDVGGKS